MSATSIYKGYVITTREDSPGLWRADIRREDRVKISTSPFGVDTTGITTGLFGDPDGSSKAEKEARAYIDAGGMK